MASAAIAAYTMAVAVSVRFAWLAARAPVAAYAAAAVVPVATALRSQLLLTVIVVVVMVVVPFVMVMMVPFMMAAVMAVMAVITVVAVVVAVVVVVGHWKMVRVHVARLLAGVPGSERSWQAKKLRPVGVLHPPGGGGLQRRGQEVVGGRRQLPKAHHVAWCQAALLRVYSGPVGVLGCHHAGVPWEHLMRRNWVNCQNVHMIHDVVQKKIAHTSMNKQSRLLEWPT